MNIDVLLGIIYILLPIGVISLCLCLGELIFGAIYRFSPRFRRKWDNYCEEVIKEDFQ